MKNLIKKIGVLLCSVSAAGIAAAQDPVGLDISGQLTDLQTGATDIISAALPALGAIAVVALGIAGFIWLFRRIRAVAFSR